MKIFKTLGAILLLVGTLVFYSCNKEEEWPKILGQEEYELTVASQKLPGVVTSCGNSSKAEVFAVKKANATEWTTYQLLKILSKEKKDSEGLPKDFIPDWFEKK